MKKVFALLMITAALSACGGSQKQGGTDSTSNANQTAKESESSVDTNANKTGTENTGTSNAPGAKLIAGSDCGTCHKVDQKVIGPSFNDVAAKYAGATDATVDTLANKIIKGGSGNWGTVPMTPHPALTPADAQTIVKYILSLKK
jgi:cytochrome c